MKPNNYRNGNALEKITVDITEPSSEIEASGDDRKSAKPVSEDPMVFETEEGLKKKKEEWSDIFNRCPDFSNLIIDLFNSKGEEGINSLYNFIVETVKII